MSRGARVNLVAAHRAAQGVVAGERELQELDADVVRRTRLGTWFHAGHAEPFDVAHATELHFEKTDDTDAIEVVRLQKGARGAEIQDACGQMSPQCGIDVH